MITTVRFDVRGVNASTLRMRAIDTLERFIEGPIEAWTITIDASEENVSSGGVVMTWRGEVTARYHRAVYEP